MSEGKTDYTWLLYLIVPIGLLVIIYYFMQNVSGGGQAFLDTYQKDYETYVAKLERYAKEDNGVLTAAHQVSKDSEEKLLQDALNKASAWYGSVIDVVKEAVIIAGVIVGGVYVAKNLPSIIQKYRGLWENPDQSCQTAYGLCNMYDAMLVDQLVLEGNIVAATNLLNTTQALWTQTSLQMTQTINALQTQIASGLLTGVQLLIAQQTIAAIQIDLIRVPVILAMPIIP